jgi:hypothetical protein
MHPPSSLWYSAFLLTATSLLAVAGWLLGGTSGLFVWLGGFLLLWAGTRLANWALNGFLLGNDRDDTDWEPQ